MAGVGLLGFCRGEGFWGVEDEEETIAMGEERRGEERGGGGFVLKHWCIEIGGGVERIMVEGACALIGSGGREKCCVHPVQSIHMPIFRCYFSLHQVCEYV